MTYKKTEQRISFRAGNDNFWDDVGILAHSQGQTRTQWTKSLVKRELIRSEVDRILARKMAECVLTMYKFMESQSSDEFSRQKQKVAEYLRQLEEHAAK